MSGAAVDSPASTAGFFAAQLAAGIGALAIALSHYTLLADTIANTTLDLLHFSLHPWNAALTALQFGIVIWDATALAAIVLLFRAAYLPWRIARGRWSVRLGVIACWTLPCVMIVVLPGAAIAYRPVIFAPALAVVIGMFATRVKGRYRQGSQAFRLTLLTIGLVLPALAFYPDVFDLAHRAKTELVETRYGPQALNQRQTIQSLMQQSLEQIDMFPGLTDLVSVPPGPAGSEAVTDRAFQVWRLTGLATYPITSSVELFGPDGRLVSRFAFNLPDDLNAVPTSEESVCTWEVFEEVSPFFAVERRVLSAGRAVCVDDPSGASHVVGSIVVHAMLDYANLPFIASQNPYVELLRPLSRSATEGVSGGDIEFAVYGWSRTPLYASAEHGLAAGRSGVRASCVRIARAVLGAAATRRRAVRRLPAQRSRRHLRARVSRSSRPRPPGESRRADGARRGHVSSLLLRDRASSALVGAPHDQRPGACCARSAPASIASCSSPSSRPRRAGRRARARHAQLRRRQMRADVEQEAVRTAVRRQRVVEDLVAPRAAQQGVGIDDNLMVWVSRADRPGRQHLRAARGCWRRASATCSRPACCRLARRPRSIARCSSHEAATVTREQHRRARRTSSPAPDDRAAGATRCSTVPLTSRQQEIEAQIDTLDRRVLLAALLFILPAPASATRWPSASPIR